jgi:3-oxoacyl-[acyl-carrier protein] reductase
MFSIEGRVALVTGAGPNNGRAIAVALAEGGAAVAVSDLRPGAAEAIREEVAGMGARVVSVPFDVTDRGAVLTGVAEVQRELGPIDILVNNAGMLPPEAIEPGSGHSGGQMGLFVDSDPAIWHRWIDVNLYGSLNCIHAVLRGMIERGWGRVVQISSASAARGTATGLSTYGAGKAGIEAAIRHISMEVAATGVTLNSLALGAVGGVERVGFPPRDEHLAGIPAGRLGDPHEVAAAVRWLVSPEAAYVMGSTIHMNGGKYQGR